MSSSVARWCARLCFALVVTVAGAPPAGAAAAAPTPPPALQGFDAYMAGILKDWNVAGIGVGVVVKDKLVFAKGYGYRDYGKKLPFTEHTTMPIASNTKLFTAMTAGLLVKDGKLDWDQPIRRYVPTIEFYNDQLNAEVSLRDMLSHRTGITRHDAIWYKSDFSRKQLFERLRYLEPTAPIRSIFLYNNMMYAGVGYVVELLGGKPWESQVRERLLGPLGMTGTVFSIDDMVAQPDHAVPYNERRDSSELYQIPYYREQVAVGPAGALNSNVADLSHWLIALMNDGRFEGKAVIPPEVVKATLAPSIALANANLESRGYGEMLNMVYGMGRFTASYRGHLAAFHGGDINGFHSQIALLPTDGVGVIVLVIGDHGAPLYNVIADNVFERMLGMSQTPWSQRQLEIRNKNKAAAKNARASAGGGQVAGTHPSHALGDFTGEFEHPAYGGVAFTEKDGHLEFEFHHIHLPLAHFHYDRFDSPDDEEEGKWSFNFATGPEGEINKVTTSLDEAEVTFTRQAARELTAPATLKQYAGDYQSPNGAKFQVVYKDDGSFGVVLPGQPFIRLVAWQPRKFKVEKFSDVIVEFVVVDGKVSEMTQTDPSGVYHNPRKGP
jgi:CubicO group peptidase (beta-lactamase class C family)